MNSVTPVFTDREVADERVIALEQKEYYPIICLQVTYCNEDGDIHSIATATRFRFTEHERRAIANGADLIISQPHHSSMMPIALQVAFPNEYPLELD